jgi:hypothetical protein
VPSRDTIDRLRSFDSLSSTPTIRSNTCGGGPSIDSNATSGRHCRPSQTNCGGAAGAAAEAAGDHEQRVAATARTACRPANAA